MRFGETWSAGVVPEWEAQYLDYKGGKKLIHKLEKEKSPVGTSMTGDPESLRLPSPALQVKDPKKEMVDERSPLLRQRAITIESPSMHNLPGSAIPLGPVNPHTTTKINTFMRWLDGEITKVNSFYTQQENVSIKKLEILRNEVKTLASHKQYQKQVRHGNKTPKTVFANFDLPTMPAAFRTRHEDSSRSTSDFSRSPVSYTHAKQLIKQALQEYYQSLQHLRGYRSLNETAMRKINKKFDKTFNVHTIEKHDQEVSHLRFIESHKLDGLTKEVETLYADNFENGNHKYAVEKLQSNPEKYPHNLEVLFTGIMLGGSLPLFLIALVTGLKHYDNYHDWETRALLNVWACWLILALMCLFFSLNILAWKRYRVNYVFIFEFDRYDFLDSREYPIMPSILFFLLSLFAWLTFNVDTVAFPGRYYPCIFSGIAVAGFLLPVKRFYFSARRWLQIAIVRLIFSGLFDVEFRDLFVGDIFCSLNYTLSNLSFFFCLYGTSHWWESEERSSQCNSSHSRVLGFLNSLPGVWRCLQCIRRYLDTGATFPHFYNAGKYSLTAFSNMFLSFARINNDSQAWRGCYITFAALNAIVCAFWDVIMDFSLGFDLREERAFPMWSYYVIIFVDPLLRFNWVLYLVYWNHKQQSDKVSFIVALLEIFRRFLWVTFRVENEHCANVSNIRAFKDLNIPYHPEASAEVSPVTHPTTPSMIPQGTRTTSHSPTAVTPRSFGQSPYITNMKKSIKRAHTQDFIRRGPTEDEQDEYDD